MEVMNPRAQDVPAPGSFSRPPALSDLAYREIEKMILAGDIATGERLNDSRLARSFGISRGPVREAIGRLASAGLIEIVKNRGAYVRVIHLNDALEIYDVRAGLERIGAMAAAESKTPELIDSLHRQVDRMDVLKEEQDEDGYYQANLTFHRTIYGASGNERLIQLMSRLERELQLFSHVSLVNAGMQESNVGHRDILAAIEKGDPELAGNMMERHVRQAKQRLIKVAETLNTSKANVATG